MKRIELTAKFRRLVRDARRGTELVLTEVTVSPQDEAVLEALGAAESQLKVIILPAAQWSSIMAAARVVSHEDQDSHHPRDQRD